MKHMTYWQAKKVEALWSRCVSGYRRVHGSKAWRSDSSKCDPLFKVISGRSVNALRRHGWVEIVFSDYAREDVLHVTALGMYEVNRLFARHYTTKAKYWKDRLAREAGRS